jgi:hypothetical protein
MTTSWENDTFASKVGNWGDVDSETESITNEFSDINLDEQTKESTPVKKFNYRITDIQKRNNIYVKSASEYVSYLEKNIRPCKFGIKCYRSTCNFMHVLPEAECTSTYLGKICKNIRKCDSIHQKRCKYDKDCNKKDCSFKHSKDMPTPESYEEYIRTMNEYNQI